MDGALDLYAESDENFDENFGQEGMMDQGQDAGVDLYNDLGDAPSNSPTKGESDQAMPEADDGGFHGGQGGQSGTGRRYSIILGNLTWGLHQMGMPVVLG